MEPSTWATGFELNSIISAYHQADRNILKKVAYQKKKKKKETESTQASPVYTEK